ncbi:transcriptional repressor LexA [Clostridium ljungdahlii]|uniref:LexA repressor n=1 Tax=Clostridium ljungdahlii TaxID=1538 RepID=A0A166RFD9_9CLOT|nr:transcriptional repressor LexA [Clostridium ljungdahlii]OAA90770.1 LexA repressor [Clostridium ljungdahlii]
MLNRKGSNQLKIYNFIKLYIKQKGYSPSIREICKAVGLSSTSSVQRDLKILENATLIKKDPAKPRTIRITKNSLDKKLLINVPIMNNIVIGNSIFSSNNIIGTFPLPISYTKNKNQLFIIKSHGESMINIGVLTGDMVILEKTNYVESGEIAAVILKNKVILERLFKSKNYIKLQPENATMKSIIVSNCTIVGKLVGVYRCY